MCGTGNPKSRTYPLDIYYSTKTYVTVFVQGDDTITVEVEDFERQLSLKTVVDASNDIARIVCISTQDDSINELCNIVYKRSNYDRAMTYKFLPDKSGQVIHECKNEKGTIVIFRAAFPSHDIPDPARKAYVDNPVRFIADIRRPNCELTQTDKRWPLFTKYLEVN